MQTRTDPRTGNALSVLGLGCMRFPNNKQETETLIKRAVELGVNYFDTAYIYGNSEEVLGDILKRNSLRDRVYIATKLPLFLIKTPEDAEKYFSRQLTRLQTGSVDYYLLHMLTDPVFFERLKGLGVLEWAEKQKAAGRIKNFGFSFHGSQADFLTLLDAYPWDCALIQYNYVDENYQAGKTGLQKAAALGIPVMIMEPLLGGRLANNLPEEAKRLYREANPDRSPADWGLRWLWNQPEVTVVLSGMSTLEQLEANCSAAEGADSGSMTESEQSTIEKAVAIIKKSDKIHCSGCNYCMPCPKHVNIPVCFSSYNLSYSMGLFTGLKLYFTGTGITSKSRANAGQCVSCGQCERHCPQKIKIARELKTVRKRLEPWYARLVVKIARFFMGVDKKEK